MIRWFTPSQVIQWSYLEHYEKVLEMLNMHHIISSMCFLDINVPEYLELNCCCCCFTYPERTKLLRRRGPWQNENMHQILLNRECWARVVLQDHVLIQIVQVFDDLQPIRKQYTHVICEDLTLIVGPVNEFWPKNIIFLCVKIKPLISGQYFRV